MNAPVLPRNLLSATFQKMKEVVGPIQIQELLEELLPIELTIRDFLPLHLPICAYPEIEVAVI
jgi:hypothetical protein